MQNLSRLLALSALGLGPLLAASASADNLLGAYAGVGIGESTVRSDSGFDPYYPDQSHPHHTAWKAMVGIRPIPFLGAEAEYIDFGHPGSADADTIDGAGYYGYGADTHPRAGVLYGVGYLPLPFLDVFAKAGVARLETHVNTVTEEPYAGGCAYPATNEESGCSVGVLSRRSESETKVAYGVGVQGHFFSALAIRGEYERISSTFGDPDAFTVSATWTF